MRVAIILLAVSMAACPDPSKKVVVSTGEPYYVVEDGISGWRHDLKAEDGTSCPCDSEIAVGSTVSCEWK